MLPPAEGGNDGASGEKAEEEEEEQKRDTAGRVVPPMLLATMERREAWLLCARVSSVRRPACNVAGECVAFIVHRLLLSLRHAYLPTD